MVFSSGGQRVAIVFATELEGDEESLGIIDDSLIIVDAARPISDAAYQHLVWRESYERRTVAHAPSEPLAAS